MNIYQVGKIDFPKSIDPKMRGPEREVYAKIAEIKSKYGKDIIIDEKQLTVYEKKELSDCRLKLFNNVMLASEEAQSLLKQLNSLSIILAAYPKNKTPERIIIFNITMNNSIGGMGSGDDNNKLNTAEMRKRIYIALDAKPEVVHHELMHYTYYSNQYPLERNQVEELFYSERDKSFLNISGLSSYSCASAFIKDEITEQNAEKLAELINSKTEYKFYPEAKSNIEKLNSIISVANPQDPDEFQKVFEDTEKMFNESGLGKIESITNKEIKTLLKDLKSLSAYDKTKELNKMNRLRYLVVRSIGASQELVADKAKNKKEASLFVTDYAQTAFGEDLAETYGLMTAGKITSEMVTPTILKKIQFIFGYEFDKTTMRFSDKKVSPSYFGQWLPARTAADWNIIIFEQQIKNK